MINTSANVVISKANEVFLRVKADPHIEYELRDHFTFQVEGAKFMPQYRNRNWNGEIHLFDFNESLLQLLTEIKDSNINIKLNLDEIILNYFLN